MSRNDQAAINEAHIITPKIGDFWHEMFCPYFVVVSVGDVGAIVLDETKPVGDHEYTFDLDKPKFLSFEEMRRQVMYDTKHAFVADVVPCGEKGKSIASDWRSKWIAA